MSATSTRASVRASVAALVLAGLAAPAASPMLASAAAEAAPAAAAAKKRVALNESVSSATGSLTTIDIAVPAGTRAPYSVFGNLRVDPAPRGSLSLIVDGETISSKPVEASRTINVPVPRSAAADGVIELGIRYDPPARETPCDQTPVQASLSGLELIYRGTPSEATTVADYFPAQVPRADVVVPEEPDAATAQAALVAVGALASRYPGTPVGLVGSDADLPEAGPLGRVVVLRPGSGAARTALEEVDGSQALVISGGSDELVDAARAIASDRLELAGSAVTSGLSAQMTSTDVGPQQSLRDLGVEGLSLSGYGTSSTGFEVRQDSFGSAVSSLDLHLEGTHTALPAGTGAQVDAYVNDTLVGSTRLDDDPSVVLDATVSLDQLESVNDVRLLMTALPTDGACAGVSARLPLSVEIDSAASGLEATPLARAGSDLGVFPQVLGGTLPVALRPEGEDVLSAAQQAASVIVSLQQAAARPLEISLVDPGELISSDGDGLLVGADERDSISLRAPMRLNRERELQTRDDSFAVDSSESYATVQSVVGSDSDDGSGSGTDGAERHVLLLGGWAPPQVRVRPVLDQAASYVGSQPWQDLSGDLLVFAPDADPVTLEASTRPVARTATADEGGSLVWWFVLGIAVLLVALAVQLVTTVRRDRATAAAVQDRPGPNGSTPARTGSRPSRPSGPASTRPTSGSRPGNKPANKPGSTSSTSGGTSRSGTKPAAGSGTKPGGDGASGRKPRDPKPSTRRQRPAGS